MVGRVYPVYQGGWVYSRVGRRVYPRVGMRGITRRV